MGVALLPMVVALSDGRGPVSDGRGPVSDGRGPVSNGHGPVNDGLALLVMGVALHIERGLILSPLKTRYACSRMH